MSRFDRSWAILPATMELWGKRKITVAECAKEWDKGTVLVCTTGLNDSIKFIHGSQGDYGVNIGEIHRCHHDQTGADKGFYRIVNILQWSVIDGNVVITSEVPFDPKTKASLSVFK